jgi:hypothetical protein
MSMNLADLSSVLGSGASGALRASLQDGFVRQLHRHIAALCVLQLVRQTSVPH